MRMDDCDALLCCLSRRYSLFAGVDIRLPSLIDSCQWDDGCGTALLIFRWCVQLMLSLCVFIVVGLLG